jgi:hypothetical protein
MPRLRARQYRVRKRGAITQATGAARKMLAFRRRGQFAADHCSNTLNVCDESTLGGGVTIGAERNPLHRNLFYAAQCSGAVSSRGNIERRFTAYRSKIP